MDSVKNTSAEAASAAVDNLIVNKNVIINALAVACGLVLVMLACAATSGLDLSAGFFRSRFSTSDSGLSGAEA